MQAHGIIEPTNSEWAALIVIIKKKDGAIRCVDYRHLNGIFCIDACPMLRIIDLIDLLGQAAHISTLNLTKGYWQVLVEKRDQQKTAFVTPFSQ